MAAAVADFRPKRSTTQKLSKEEGLPELVLEPTPDILAGLAARRRPGQVLVGFAAETHEVLERGNKTGPQGRRPAGRERRERAGELVSTTTPTWS